MSKEIALLIFVGVFIFLMVGIVNPEALDWPGFPPEGSKKDRLIFIRIICVLFLFEFLFLFSKIFKDWFRFL